ncbi:nucleolar complex protein 14 [Lobosporangium transversale]|uniref:Nucleolar protein 14 n=1 Tax=Lobosporangium transversale TaxID=64571 RepID=A0A1Y2GF84_9FUNG|nr:nucleolar protein 14 [Lobosporangium transversale]KAF9908923.1 nucleolar complex protein 14 [Lobosporangium transversale]ORZ09114.1 nucleolar protein 14 [Lobosporangium transversale]|eukprot:XP_021878741.1 nucleolar protein 14 [Lobosporangium transversale]
MAKSALYRLKSSLKEAGAIGPNSRASLSKKDRKKGRPTAGSVKNDLNKKLAHIKEAMNQFEIKTTRQKYDVLGRKIKGVQGKPTLSKQIGEENRRKTLLKEMQKKNKAGGLIDKRFGEENPNMTPEEKMLERFTREKQSRAKGGAMFNLEDEADLTHYGQSLAGLDDFDETELGFNDDDDDNRGQIGRDIVSHTHFGGFDDETLPSDTHEDGRPKTKAEVMKEIIAKSKFHKHERQKEKEEIDDITKELDDELEDIRGLLGFSNPDAEERRPKRAPLPSQSSTVARALDRLADEEKERMKADREGGALDKGFDDDYDKHIRELAFDRRAKPQDRMKSEEEIAQEEVEKLEKSERARKRRMEGLPSEEIEDEQGGYKKRRKAAPAADDLDDDFAPDENDEFGLGAGMDADESTFRATKPGRMPSKKHRTVKVDDSDSEGEEEEEEDIEEEEESEAEDDDEEDGDEEEDSEDDFSDLDMEMERPMSKGGEDDDDEDDINDLSSAAKTKKPVTSTKSTAKKAKIDVNPDAAAAAAELPYTFPSPTSLEHFLSIIENIELEHVPTVVHRIRALHHPKLSPQNKAKMQIFYPVLLDYVFQISASEASFPIAVLNKLTRHIYAMTSQLGDHATECILGFLESFEAELIKDLASETKSGFPTIDKLTFFRILGEIYSTSDFQHQVITPAQLLMSQYLGQCQIKSFKDLASGLMLCNLFLDYQKLSKRVIPEAINFLSSALVYLAPKGTFGDDLDKLPGLFPIQELDIASLQMTISGLGSIEVERLSIGLFKKNGNVLENNKYKVSAMSAAADLLMKYALLYASTSAYKEMFEGPIGLLKILSSSKSIDNQNLNFSSSLKDRLSASLDRIQKLESFSTDSRAPLQLQAHKPVPIASYVPKFEEGYSLDKHYDPDVERAQAHKLQMQVKKEKKGAIRELRKDAQFVAREKLKDQREKDQAYNAKIKGIMSGLEADQGEKNAESRMKKVQKLKGKRN